MHKQSRTMRWRKFRKTKPIKESDCCESRMAERIQWLTETWLELCVMFVKCSHSQRIGVQGYQLNEIVHATQADLSHSRFLLNFGCIDVTTLPLFGHIGAYQLDSMGKFGHAAHRQWRGIQRVGEQGMWNWNFSSVQECLNMYTSNLCVLRINCITQHDCIYAIGAGIPQG